MGEASGPLSFHLAAQAVRGYAPADGRTVLRRMASARAMAAFVAAVCTRILIQA